MTINDFFGKQSLSDGLLVMNFDETRRSLFTIQRLKILNRWHRLVTDSISFLLEVYWAVWWLDAGDKLLFLFQNVPLQTYGE